MLVLLVSYSFLKYLSPKKSSTFLPEKSGNLLPILIQFVVPFLLHGSRLISETFKLVVFVYLLRHFSVNFLPLNFFFSLVSICTCQFRKETSKT